MATDRERGAEIGRAILFLEGRGEVKDIRPFLFTEKRDNPDGFAEFYAGLEAALEDGEK